MWIIHLINEEFMSRLFAFGVMLLVVSCTAPAPVPIVLLPQEPSANCLLLYEALASFVATATNVPVRTSATATYINDCTAANAVTGDAQIVAAIASIKAVTP